MLKDFLNNLLATCAFMLIICTAVCAFWGIVILLVKGSTLVKILTIVSLVLIFVGVVTVTERRKKKTKQEEDRAKEGYLWAPGTCVRHLGTGEVGIVICSWNDSDGDREYYVAFYKNAHHTFPVAKPDKPSVLRYYGTSIERYRP